MQPETMHLTSLYMDLITGSRQLTVNKLTGDNWLWSTDRQQIGRRHKPIGNKLAGDTNQPLYTNQPLVVSN